MATQRDIENTAPHAPRSSEIPTVAIVSPEYFRKHGVPEHPSDLDDHACLTLRFQSHAPAYDWEFEKDDEAIVKKVHGPLIFSESDLCIEAAKEGHGIAFVTETVEPPHHNQ